jgi:endonuclease YncB( thermonuclease family)
MRCELLHTGAAAIAKPRCATGDTIAVGGMPIRRNGLAASESDEPGGAAATKAMIELVQGGTLRCELEGKDIAAEMVRQGLARDCPVGRKRCREQSGTFSSPSPPRRLPDATDSCLRCRMAFSNSWLMMLESWGSLHRDDWEGRSR